MNVEAKWVSLNADEIAPPKVASDANWVAESPSPYDVPTHVRSFYDAKLGIFTIELRYISPEPVKDIDLRPYIRLAVGHKTNRIYAIRFDIHNFNRDRIRIAKETHDSIASWSGGKEPSNRDIALRVIDRQQKLFAAVV
jgi:hypothetical protein